MAVNLGETRLGILLQKLANVDNDSIWASVFKKEEFQTWILDLIRKDQLFDQGIDGNGNIIGYYSAVTEMINPQKKQGTPYTLYDTGEFYKSFTIVVMPNILEIDADPVKKDDNLFVKYGEDIIKLTDENMERLRLEVIERYYAEITALLLVY